MIDTNLILIDGLPGSGKSSTAQHLWLHLLDNRVDVNWFYEHQISHPIYSQNYGSQIYQMILNQPWGAALRNSRTVRERSLHKWRKLAESLEGTNRVGILEGTFFQNTIGWLQMLNLPREEILDHAARIRESIEKVHPVLIYLYQTEPTGVLRRTRADRGEWFEQVLVSGITRTPFGRIHGIRDFEGVIEFLLRVRSITDEIYEHSPFTKLAVDTTDRRWTSYLDRITDVLALPRIDHQRDVPTNLDALTGTYQAQALWRKESLRISADNGGLFFPEANGTRLIHKAATTFCIQGMRLEVSFRLGDGSVHMECVGDIPGLPRLWRKVAEPSR